MGSNFFANVFESLASSESPDDYFSKALAEANQTATYGNTNSNNPSGADFSRTNAGQVDFKPSEDYSKIELDWLMRLQAFGKKEI